MKIEFAKKWNSVLSQWKKFYPISITPAIIDADRGQRLNATLADIYSKIPSQSYATEAECISAAQELTQDC